MARTKDEILENMLTAKAAQSNLNALNSSSLMGYTMALLEIVAIAIAAFEGILDLFKAEIKADINQAKIGTLPWWQKVSLEYQHGYEITVTADVAEYTVLDEDAQIIKASSAVEDVTVVGGVTLKVAGVDGSGEFTPLSTPELDGFRAYLKKIKPVGPPPAAVSLNGDIFKLEAEVFFDPLVFAPDGSLLSDSSVFPVKDAIEAYRRALLFDGVIDLHRLQDRVQDIPGVNNFVLGDASINLGSGFNLVGRRYTTVAGYFLLATTPGNTLDDTLTYTAGQ